MKKTLLVLLPAILLISIFSCKKDTFIPVAGPVKIAPLDKVYATQALSAKKVSFDAGTTNSFYGNSGTRYVFRPNSFMTAGGNIVAGNVDVEVIEYLMRGDMIFSKVLPVSNGEPLVSGGQLLVKASQNGEAVFLRSNAFYEANVPQFGKKSTDMRLFSGTRNIGLSTVNNVNWTQVNQDSSGHSGLVYKGDTITIFCNFLDFVNIDKYFKKPDLNNCNIDLEGVDLPSGTLVYAYALYDDINVLTYLPYVPGKVNNLVSQPLHFVVATVVNDEFYGGILAATPVEGGKYTVSLTKTEPAKFKAAINDL